MRRIAKSKSSQNKFQGNNPTLLYFTTADCMPCKTFQRPVVQQLQEMLSGHLNLVEIDAISNSEMAKQWGVLSVPTIFILDTQGRPQHINHGITSKEKLLTQLNSLSYY
jgi:thiol-disulfide isomerase/thioredoxin